MLHPSTVATGAAMLRSAKLESKQDSKPLKSPRHASQKSPRSAPPPAKLPATDWEKEKLFALMTDAALR